MAPAEERLLPAMAINLPASFPGRRCTSVSLLPAAAGAWALLRWLTLSTGHACVSAHFTVSQEFPKGCLAGLWQLGNGVSLLVTKTCESLICYPVVASLNNLGQTASTSVQQTDR